MNMSIPAFPSQELAKLVLGYLAEEQLMTAYDEFLQASPYLDAHSNEYDRIFMTSLRNILSEYRAVKICVETCKPISLRKKMFKCANLLEVVKFLIQNTNISEIGVQETTTDKLSKNKVSSITRTSSCDLCNSLRLGSCMCMTSNTAELNHINLKNNSGDTTPLSDLPGSHVKQKQTITKPAETNTLSSSFGAATESDSYSSKLNIVETDTEAGDTSATVAPVPAHSNLHQESSVTPHQYLANNKHTTPESAKLEEFNKILDLVSSQNGSINKKTFSHNLGLSEVQKKVSGAENFQVFSSGITGDDKGKEKGTIIVPDSSTSEHCTLQEPANKNQSSTSQVKVSHSGKKRVIKRQYLLKVATVDNNTICKVNNEFVDSSNVIQTSQHKDDPKITILSDVKVDNVMPPVLKSNATSTPLMQMRTLMIDGTPVYHQLPNVASSATTYTKDEIMAMPTIILMPSSAPPGGVTNTLTTSITSRPNAPIQSVEPLIIDISPERPNQLYDKRLENPNDNIEASVNSKTFDAQNEVKDSNITGTAALTVKNATAPKDESGISKTSTPHVLPPKRKSSSTPRRSSHIRVLDFATPRRILHEAINERPSLEEEVIISQSPNLAVSNNVAGNKQLTSNPIERVDINRDLTLKENCNISNDKNQKKRNWDADLRALAIASPGDGDKVSKPKPATKRKTKNKLKNSNEVKNKTSKVKKSTKKNKNKFPENELIVIDDTPTETEINVANINRTTPTAEKLIKPTINIVSRNDWCSTAAPDNDKSQNKLVCNDTPELDRISLHNAIDSKLNISELLETPYKQALYDIQMGTPRFLGPDLPDVDPMSEIKIMNIPTPRFLSTPKPVQATPGSYSSRPTDYSSGGSYYKPDDIDFVPSIDCQIISSNNDSEKSVTTATRKSNESETSKPNNTKSSRPTRKCAKNVSYYNISMGKNKESDDKSSTCSETVSNSSMFDNSKENKHSKDDRNKRKPTVKSSIPKPTKSPVKKVTPKTVIKNKTKVSLTKTLSARKIKTPESSRRVSSKPSARKRTNSKEKQVTPITMPAPTKSRRKSSTPRKLECSKQFNSLSSERDVTKNKIAINKKVNSLVTDSDAEQTPLRWSDDCSHDSSTKNQASELNDTDDITKIKEFIETSVSSKSDFKGPKSSTQEHLIKRGFDAETAKIIERDLLDLRPESETRNFATSNSKNDAEEEIVSSSHEPKSDIKDNQTTKETVKESESNISSDTVDGELKENAEDGDFDEIELSVHECNEDTNNSYRMYNFDSSKDFHVKELPKLKDTYSMEVCIDEQVSIRLRATTFNTTLDLEPQEIERYDYSYRETENAVKSISNIEYRLYTPMKARAQCVELFDSTLTSLDTPLKCADQTEHESTVTDIVLEVEHVEERQDTKKRKRQTDETNNESKKPKTDVIFNNISNINDSDIENVLTKLHGP